MFVNTKQYFLQWIILFLLTYPWYVLRNPVDIKKKEKKKVSTVLLRTLNKSKEEWPATKT